MKYKNFKVKAKKSLSKNYKTIIPAFLILIVLSIGCCFIAKVTHTQWLNYPLTLIVDALFMLGFVNMISNAAKNRKVKLEQLVSKTDMFFKYIGVILLVGLFVGVLCLLEAISFRSLVVVVTYQAEINFGLSILLIVFGLILTTTIVLTIIYMIICFSQVLFILNDEPELTVRETLSKSFDMMEDYVVDYFMINISFIGWIILGILTFGILYIWLIPYMYLTMAHFYEYIKKDYQKALDKEKILNDEDQKETEE